jgi:hypothetical protein
MPFSYQDGIKIRDLVAEKGGKISRQDLANLLRKQTNTMAPWWIKSYMETMCSANMLKIDADGQTFVVVSEVSE